MCQLASTIPHAPRCAQSTISRTLGAEWLPFMLPILTYTQRGMNKVRPTPSDPADLRARDSWGRGCPYPLSPTLHAHSLMDQGTWECMVALDMSICISFLICSRSGEHAGRGTLCPISANCGAWVGIMQPCFHAKGGAVQRSAHTLAQLKPHT